MRTKIFLIISFVILGSHLMGQPYRSLDAEAVFKSQDYEYFAAMLIGNSTSSHYRGESAFHCILFDDYAIEIGKENITLKLLGIGYNDLGRNGWSENDQLVYYWEHDNHRYSQKYTNTYQGMREVTEGLKPWGDFNQYDKFLNMMIANIAIQHAIDEYSKPKKEESITINLYFK